MKGRGLTLASANESLAVASNGSFQFKAGREDGFAYSVAVTSQPKSPSQTCEVARHQGVIAGHDVTDVAVSCTTDRFKVGGVVTGLEGSGLRLSNSAGAPIDIARGAGPQSFVVNEVAESGSPFDITVAAQPEGPHQTCRVTNGQGTVEDRDIDAIQVNCSTNTYAVRGTVSGLRGSGLVLHNNGADAHAISRDGSFAFPSLVKSGALYDVTVAGQPRNPAQTCTLARASGRVVGGDVSDVAVECQTNRYTVRAVVTGLSGGTLVLKNRGTDQLSVTANGTFPFVDLVTSGEDYELTVDAQPSAPAQTCSVAEARKTVTDQDVSVSVSCRRKAFSVGGTVSGLTGAGLQLANGTATLPVQQDGSFTFPGQVLSGDSYAITVNTQPAGQYCSVTNGSGTMGAADVTAVAVRCQSTCGAGLQPGSPWPMLGRCRDHSRRAVTLGPRTNAVKWSVDIGAMSGVVIGADGTVYVNTNSGLSAIRPTDGHVLWSNTSCGGRSFSTPAIGTDGTIYYGIGNTVCAVAPDGTKRWQTDIGGAAGTPSIGADGTIFIGHWGYWAPPQPEVWGQMVALSPSGVVRWRSVDAFIQTAPAIGADGTVFVGGNGAVWAFRPNNGSVLWSRTTVSDGVPAISAGGDTLFVQTRDEGLLALATSNGNLRWASGSMGWGGIGLMSNGTVLTSEYRLAVRAVDGQTGTTRWSKERASWQIGIDQGPALGSDDTVYYTSNDGKLYAASPSGLELWAVTIGSGNSNSPAIAFDGTLFVTGGGKLWAVGP